MNKRLLYWLVLAIGIILIINLSRSVFDLLGKEKIIGKAEIKLEKSKELNKELKIKLKKVQSAEFIEKQAREKLNLAREGELVVILPKITQIPKTRHQKPELSNWQKWLEVFR